MDNGRAQQLNQDALNSFSKHVGEFMQSHFSETKQDLLSSGGEDIAAALEQSLGRVKSGELDEVDAEKVRKSCWEKLSVGGGWPNFGWREAYVDSLLTLALSQMNAYCALESHDDTLTHLKEAMKHLDLALIMGGPATHEIAQEMVTVVEPTLKTGLMDIRKQPADNTPTIVDGLPAASPSIDKDHAIKREHNIGFADFKKKYFKTDTPVVITGVIDDWPGMQKWKDLHYLRNEFGHRTVPLEIGRLVGGKKQEGWREATLTMEEFVDSYLVPSNARCRDGADGLSEEVAYLAQHQLFDQLLTLQQDLIVPDYTECGGLEGINAWLGTAGTVTPLHTDSYDNLLTQAVGYKYVRLYDHLQTRYLYVTKAKDSSQTEIQAQGNISPIECESPDFEKYPLLRQAKYTETILGPGDMLYIPSNTWHYVRSLSCSFSVNFWF